MSASHLPAEIRAWVPLEEPPQDLSPKFKAELRSREPAFGKGFQLSTHVIQAAFPRIAHDAQHLRPDPVPSDASKAERREILATQTDKLIDGRLVIDDKNGTRKPLLNVLNRFKRKESATGSKDLTLLFVHANGFNKETYEPSIEHLIAADNHSDISEIWVMEFTTHGESYRANEPNLPFTDDWRDHARDIVNFLSNYLPTEHDRVDLPTQLPRLSRAESSDRLKNGFRKRHIVTIGHSFGGTATAIASTNFPALFDSIILVDPVIVPFDLPLRSEIHDGLVKGALSRRDTWASREAALAAFTKSPFFNTWDDHVLKLYIAYGTTEIAKGEQTVTLSTPGLREALTFSENKASVEAFKVVKYLNKRVHLRWVLPDPESASFPVTGGEGTYEAKFVQRPGNTSHGIVKGAGHLIPQEQPLRFGEYYRS